MPFPIRLAAFLALLTVVTPAFAVQEAKADLHEVRLQIERLLDTPRLQISGDEVYMQNVLRETYSAHSFEPVWITGRKITELVSLLRDSRNHGLRPADYHLELIESRVAQAARTPGATVVAERDILLSDGLMLYIHHRNYGKVSRNDMDGHFNSQRDPALEARSLEDLIHEAQEAPSLAALVESVLPTADYYELLRGQLLRYMELTEHGGWPDVTPGPTLRNGDQDPRVAGIRQRLQVTGELSAAAIQAADYFDAELESAVRKFQESHGLEVDGLVGKQTVSAMNVPAGARVNQLRLSLERLRWVAQDAGQEFIAVNIAGFRLSFVRNRQVVWTTRVMVGTPYRQTPVFRSDITYLEFNPTWTVPPTILREDVLPAIRKDPGYLAQRHIAVIDPAGRTIDPAGVDWSLYRRAVPFTLRQEPGPDNALGKVKFIFPNPYSVYMHDTPHQALFARPERTFSSGCIRVENALHLAELVLQGQPQFSLDDMQNILESGRTQRVLLEKPLPVLILYLTAALDASGKARFYSDIYHRDAAVLRALDGPVVLDAPLR